MSAAHGIDTPDTPNAHHPTDGELLHSTFLSVMFGCAVFLTFCSLMLFVLM